MSAPATRWYGRPGSRGSSPVSPVRSPPRPLAETRIHPRGGWVPSTVMSGKRVRVPPRWFVRLFWYSHRGMYRITRGRIGLWNPKPGRWGALRLTTIGRRTGQERSVILGYFDDGPLRVTMAMNGWSSGEPLWWLNTQAHPRERIAGRGGDNTLW